MGGNFGGLYPSDERSMTAQVVDCNYELGRYIGLLVLERAAYERV